MTKTRQVSIAIAAAALLMAQSASATNGYFTHGIGTKNKGLAGAGTASPQETISAASNSAAAVMVEGKFAMGLSVFSPRRSYQSGPSLANGNGGAFTIGPNDLDSGREYFPIPYIGKAWRLDDNSAIAVNFYGRGGMNTEWNGGTASLDPDGPGPAPVMTLPGTYGAGTAGVNLSQAFLDVAYAVNKGNLNIGVTGVIAMQAFKAKGLGTFAGFARTFAASGGTVIPTNLTDNGTDFSYGWGLKVGAIYSVNEQLNVGASYQSKTFMSEFDKYADLFADSGSFDIPPSLSLSASYSATSTVSLHFDFERTLYSDIDALANPIQNLFGCPTAGAGGTDLESCLGGVNSAGFKWDDVDVYKFGIEWIASANTTLRAGYSTAKQPIGNDQILFNILAPGVVEQHFTAGATRLLSNGNELSVSVMYAPSNTVGGTNTFDPTQQIEIEMHQFELEIGYSF
jgi:long-chain fatty acid transport protein